jgi:hypothetical protein
MLRALLRMTSVFAWTAVALVLVTGCSVRLADLTMVSTKNVSLSKVDLDKLPQTQGVIAKDSRMIVLGIPLGFPHLENAVDEALEMGKGDLMTDAVITAKGWSIFLVGQNTLEVKGSVVRTRATGE